MTTTLSTLNAPVQILISISENYLAHSVTFIKNILAFQRQPFTVYVLYSFNQPESHVASYYQELNTLDWVQVCPKQIDHATRKQYEADNQHLDNPQNLRLYATLLGISGRLLYLDLDILICDDFSALFTMDMQGKTIATVADSYIMYENILSQGAYMQQRMQAPLKDLDFLDQQHYYFNSGVMLIDMDKLNQTNLWLNNLAKLAQFTRLQDQSFLNYLHYDDSLNLSNNYNYLAYHLILNRAFLYKHQWIKHPHEMVITDITTTFKKATPVFLHFAGKQKQWNTSATEFVDYFNSFNVPVTEILAQEPSYYKKAIRKLYYDFDYILVLNDLNVFFTDYQLTNFTVKQLKAYRQQPEWTYNPILLNTKLMVTHGFIENIQNALISSYREKLNTNLYKQLQRYNQTTTFYNHY